MHMEGFKRCFKKHGVSGKPLNHSRMRKLTYPRLRGGVRQELVTQDTSSHSKGIHHMP